MLWYSARDKLFAPFNIKTANYTKHWQLKIYAFLSAQLPIIRHTMLWVRTYRRKRQSIKPEDLSKKAEVVIGHFAVAQLIDYLPPNKHSYRTVVRDPLYRMWSHYCHWHAHKGDVGYRVVPQYRPDMPFEEFALLPELQNYQTQAVGNDLGIYEYIGTTEALEQFAIITGLIGEAGTMPKVNHFSKETPYLSESFLDNFKKLHAEDYALYRKACWQ